MEPSRRTPLLIATAIAIGAIVVFGFILSEDTDTDADPDPAVGSATEIAPVDSGDAGSGNESEPKPEPKKPERVLIEVEGGQPKGGVGRLEFDKGDRVRLKIASDVGDHVHVHGYDLFEDVAAGGPAKFSFTAGIDGVFEIELEEAGVQIAELRVNP